MATDGLSISEKLPLIVIAGPTASGKTALAIKLAKEFNGEIICADSRTVYKGMDIGTAKPSIEYQEGVMHWGLNLVEPGEQFSVANFKAYANDKILNIRSRGKVPFLVGGTGLFIDAVIFDYDLSVGSNNKLRGSLSNWTVEELQLYCQNNNITMPENNFNKRYLIRAIEKGNIISKRQDKPADNVFVVGITTNNHILRTRIEFRAEQIVNSGVVEETTALVAKYGWENEAMTGNIYGLVGEYLAKQINKHDLTKLCSVRDWQLAKRQMTWLRRNPYLMWGDLKSAEHYLLQQLAKN